MVPSRVGERVRTAIWDKAFEPGLEMIQVHQAEKRAGPGPLGTAF